MSDKIIYDFVCSFLPEHKKYWDCLSEKEAALLNNIKYKREELEKVFFEPEENPELVEKFRDKLDDLQVFFNHRECVYDYFLFYDIRFTHPHILLAEDYEFIFNESEKYAVQIKEPKSIESYMKKILQLLPPNYQEKPESRERQYIFGSFKKKLDSYLFTTDYYCSYNSIVEFKRSQMNLIPAFIEYRCKNLVRWSCQMEARNQYKIALMDITNSDCVQALKARMPLVCDLFRFYLSKKIREICSRHGLAENWSFRFEFDYHYEYCIVNYVHSSAHCWFSYKIMLDDVFTNLKRFDKFMANTETKFIY